MDKQADIHKDQEEGLLDNPDRRKLFKWGAAAAGVAATGAAGGWVSYRVQGVPHKTFPVEIDDTLLKPFDQRNMVFSYAISQKLQQEYPRRNRAFAKEIGIPDFTFTDVMKSLKHHQSVDPDAWDNSTLGYRQLDWALGTAANGPLDKFLGPYSKFGVPNTGEHTWEQLNLAPVKWQFSSSEDASQYIKRAARLYGADRVGITRNDPRWNYSPLYDAVRCV